MVLHYLYILYTNYSYNKLIIINKFNVYIVYVNIVNI